MADQRTWVFEAHSLMSMHFASILSVVVAAIVGVVAAEAAAAGGVAAAESETIIYQNKNTPICCSAQCTFKNVPA